MVVLPESWTSDADRMARAPPNRPAFRSKPKIAIDEVDWMRAAGVRFGSVLADAGYGMSAPFRSALSERGLQWAVGIPRHQKVYPGYVALIFPVAGRGLPAAATYPRPQVDLGAGRARGRVLALGQLAPRHKRSIVGTLRRCEGAGRRRLEATHPRHGRPTHARRRGMADRRTSRQRRAQILPRTCSGTPLKALASTSRRGGSASRRISN